MKEDSIDVKSFSNFSSVESLGGAYRAEATDQWTTSDGITAKCYHSLTGQLRGSCMRLVVQVIYKVKYQKELMVKTRDVLEQCMTTSGRAAGVKARRRSRARREASAKEVSGYYNQCRYSNTLGM